MKILQEIWKALLSLTHFRGFIGWLATKAEVPLDILTLSRPVVIICTTMFNPQISPLCSHNVFLGFV